MKIKLLRVIQSTLSIAVVVLYLVALWMFVYGIKLMLGGYIFNAIAHYLTAIVALKFIK